MLIFFTPVVNYLIDVILSLNKQMRIDFVMIINYFNLKVYDTSL